MRIRLCITEFDLFSIHMLLSDIQIKRAKPKDKPYTLNDGMGLSLLIDTAGSKGWRYRYRFAGKPKMISFGVYGDVSLAQARAKRDEARSMLAKGINPSEARKADKIALQFAHDNSFESVAREWHGSKRPPGLKGMLKRFSIAWKRTFSLLSAYAQSNKLNH